MAQQTEYDPSDPIDNAIIKCNDYIESQQTSARRVLMILIYISVTALTLLGMFVYFIFTSQERTGYELSRDISSLKALLRDKTENGEKLPEITLGTVDPPANNTGTFNLTVFAILSAFTVVFGVSMSVYRFHLNEISKTEHYKIGFIRIRIAAESKRKGYQSEVRSALTDRPFDPPARAGLVSRNVVSNPMPGNPSTDALTSVLNKILERIDPSPTAEGEPKA